MRREETGVALISCIKINIQVRANSYIIWFVGAVVWWIDAALHLHAGSRDHALLAIAVSLLFLAAGVVFRRQALRK
jgi:hypothetical protein